MGYEDPALEGDVITFTCSPGQLLNGTDTSTCMRNGEWEPDPGEVDCIGLPASMTTGAPTSSSKYSLNFFIVYLVVIAISK